MIPVVLTILIGGALVKGIALNLIHFNTFKKCLNTGFMLSLILLIIVVVANSFSDFMIYKMGVDDTLYIALGGLVVVLLEFSLLKGFNKTFSSGKLLTVIIITNVIIGAAVMFMAFANFTGS
ncbi:hypothetical protein BKI52_26665 [marine bacterium AO1-C]|nr:hypothetical protein BKI52_26665 [marine bacterium AO1-C]